MEQPLTWHSQVHHEKLMLGAVEFCIEKWKTTLMITRNELKNDLEAVGSSVSSRTIIRELHNSNIINFKPRKTPNS